MDAAVGLEAQRVHRLREQGALAGVLRERRGLELERHGDVAAARDVAALGGLAAEGRDAFGECAERNEPPAVFHLLAAQLREARVDARRAAVLDGVAHDAVQVHGVCLP